jgi:uncharacterized protein (DUF433 family)
MTLQVAYPHVERSADGVAVLKAHPRIRVAQIAMDYLAHGWSAEEMCRQHPYLSLAEAHAALLYYLDHQDEIDAEIRAEWEHLERESAIRPLSRIWSRIKAQGRI